MAALARRSSRRVGARALVAITLAVFTQAGVEASSRFRGQGAPGSSGCDGEGLDTDCVNFLQRRGEAERKGAEKLAPGKWTFSHAYPNQYVAKKLGQGQQITIDGKLDDPAWKEVPFTETRFVDIAQPLFPNYVLPEEYETKVKVRWDAEYLYVGAILGEKWVQAGSVTGSNKDLKSTLPIGNSNVPYYDNDFEVFIDVSGTNYYYKEFEMNYNNATYDVLWRASDGGFESVGVPCCSDNKCDRWCMNSSWPGFGGTWSMYPNMKTATAKVDTTDGSIPGWSAEIAFPLKEKDGKGGLLSGGPDWSSYDPNSGAKYWLIDFSRAEHPFFTSNVSNLDPLCSLIQKSQPTLLGADQWSCYWEWTWQSLGGHKYMHNPENFGFLQFANNLQEPVCANVEWPVRYVLAQIYQAEIAFAQAYGRYEQDLAKVLAEQRFCTVNNACNATDLQEVMGCADQTFNLTIEVDNAATSCVRYATKQQQSNYTGGPCFTARLNLKVPGSAFEVKGSIREDRYLEVHSEDHERPCLPLS